MIIQIDMWNAPCNNRRVSVLLDNPKIYKILHEIKSCGQFIMRRARRKSNKSANKIC
jgi:hypothetical protein